MGLERTRIPSFLVDGQFCFGVSRSICWVPIPIAQGVCAEDVFVGPRKSILTLKVEVRTMSLGTILIILLVLALVGVMPTWGYSNSWGYAPGGIVGVLLV